jgi:ribonuclease J
MSSSNNELVFLPLGGLGEIGMNAALYGFGPELNRQWILVDCGMGFGGEEHLPGIDVVYPDLSFIEEERHNLLGIFITHAHEDHIGALVEMWPRLQAPVYATKFAIGLLETRRLSEPGAPKIELIEITPNQRLNLGLWLTRSRNRTPWRSVRLTDSSSTRATGSSTTRRISEA